MKRFLRLAFRTGLLFVVLYVVMLFTPWQAAMPGFHRLRYPSSEYPGKVREFQLGLDSLARKNDTKAAAALMRNAVQEDLFQYWKGTRWNFNGTTETPGKGSIACGYFVTTLLRDMRVPLDREKYAQMASEKMIRKLVSKKAVAQYSNISLPDFVKKIRAKGDHVYVLGLDNHVGLLVCENKQVSFIHSSGRWPWAVVKEDAAESIVLKKSKYRVTGCLTGDEQFMQRWLQSSLQAAR